MSTASIQAAQVSQNIGTTPTVIGGYIVPAATGAVVTGGTVCNTTASAVTVSVSIWNGSSDIAFIMKAQTIAPNSTVPFAGSGARFTLGTGQGIRVVSSAATSIDAVMGIVQVG